MQISDRTSFIKSSTLKTLLTELGEECQTVLQLLDKIRAGNQLSDSEKGDSLAELLAAMIHLQNHWILQENLGYPILIRLADVDQPIRDYLTQNWLRDATGSLTGVSPEWVAGFERLIRPLPNPPLKGEGTGKHGGTNSSPRLATEGSGKRSKQGS